METDFTALASRVAATGELRACIVLSRDGFVLGAFPPGGEDDIRPAWLRVAGLGEPTRGFVDFGQEIWVFVRRGAYAAFAIGGPTSRPGILLDQLDQALALAEDARTRRDAVRPPESIDLARTGPRAGLHPEARPPAPVAPGPAPARPPVARPPAEAASQPGPPAPAAPPARPAFDPDEDVDRVTLAFEFSQLLQEGREGDE
ncbi:MAG: hypothetical protein HY658_03120 [Actinobacteria bacterium]|nr:hypothetical protein [Actinomycetota bacterium]